MLNLSLLVALIKYKEIKSFLFRKVDKNNQKNIEKMSNPVLNYWAPSQHLCNVLYTSFTVLYLPVKYLKNVKTWNTCCFRLSVSWISFARSFNTWLYFSKPSIMASHNLSLLKSMTEDSFLQYISSLLLSRGFPPPTNPPPIESIRLSSLEKKYISKSVEFRYTVCHINHISVKGYLFLSLKLQSRKLWRKSYKLFCCG